MTKSTNEELQEYIIKLEHLIQYHVLTASDYLKQIEQMEKIIEERMVQNAKNE